MDRKALEAKAKKLDIDFNEDTSDDELQKLIEEAEEEFDSSNSDPEYLKEEMKRAIEARDKAKREKRKFKEDLDKTKKEMQELQDRMKGLPDGDTLTQLKKELKELKEYRQTVEEEKRQAEESNMDEIGKLKARLERKEKEAEELVNKTRSEVESTFKSQLEEALGKVNQYEKTVSSLRKSKLEGDVIKAAHANKAIKPADIFRMVKDDFEFDAEEGKFYHYTRDKKGGIADEKDVDEYIKDFLSKEENDYLVEASVRGNSFHSNQSSDDSKNKKSFKGSGKYDPNDAEVVKGAKDLGLSVEDWIEIQEKKDAKFERIEANRQK
jgi:DNA repair exonuclease SbcCD ATPase subunit